MSAPEELTFHLDDFDGPLDLLLALVAKHKMDLHNIPILELINQYTAVVEKARQQDPGLSSAFIETAARLVEMKSYLLLPRSAEGERMKEELTGQLIEYDLCRRMAALLEQRAAGVTVFVRGPAPAGPPAGYPLHHSPQVLADCWQAMAGRGRPAPVRQEVFEPLVTAPFVSVESRVVYILRRLVTGQVKKLNQLFSRRQERSATVATFLAVLELVRAGRVRIEPDAQLTVRRGRLPERTRKEDEDGTGND